MADRSGADKLVYELRAHQRECWLRGERIWVETLVAEYPTIARDPERVLDLIYAEFCLREELGDEPAAQEYLDRFPQLADGLDVLIDVSEAMRQPESEKSSPALHPQQSSPQRSSAEEPNVEQPSAAAAAAPGEAATRKALAWLMAATIVVIVGLGAGGLFYLRFDHQRVQLAQRDTHERELLEATRGAASDLLVQGEQAIGRGDLSGAQLQLSNTLAKIGPESQLTELKQRGERLLAQVKNELEFKRLYDDAIFHGSQFTGLNQVASIHATRQAAAAALTLAGLAPGKTDDPTTAAASSLGLEAVHLQCYELLLVLAEATAEPAAAGESRITQGRRALKVLERARRLIGRSTQAWYLEQARYLDQVRDRTAAAEARRLAADPQLRSITAADHFLLGKVLLGDSGNPARFAEASAHFEEALRLEPNHFWAQYFLGLAAVQAERPELAKASLIACATLRPDFVWIYILKGFVHSQLGEFDAAEADFRKADQLPTDEAARYTLLVNRGVTHFLRGRLDEAAKDLDQARRLKPDEFQAYVNLARVDQKQDRLDAALGHLNEAIRLQPHRPELYRLRAQIHVQRHEPQDAIDDYDRTIRHEPEGALAAADNTEQARLLQQQQQLDAALAAYDRALQMAPEAPLPNLLRAELLIEKKRYRDAIASYDAFLAHGKPNAQIYLGRGLARASIGDLGGSIDDYSRAIELEPTSELYAKRGWTYVWSEAPLVGLRDFEEAIRLDPANADAYNGRGFCLAKLKRPTAAVIDAEEALKLASSDARTQYKAARTYSQALVPLEPGVVRRYRPALELRQKYVNRALQLIAGAVDLARASGDRDFWKNYIQDDKQLDPIRATEGFALLAARYAKADK